MATELGSTSLSQARLARGLTLEDAERSTRISRRFLEALEEHNYTVFPAPIYARGFLRTYCRYLGVDPEHQLAELPEGWAASPPATPLPPISRGSLTFNPAWIVAGILIIALAGLGVFLGRSGNELGSIQAQSEQGAASEAQTGNEGGQGATAGGNNTEAPGSATTPSTPTQTLAPRPLDPGLPGRLPDFTDVMIEDATNFLSSQQIAYLRIDATSASTLRGIVMDQTPDPGSATGGLSQVTLTVSAGPTIAAATRTDCDVLDAASRRTTAEQAYFEDNCTGSATSLPDRTNCEEIRGTDYHSAKERSFFLANCILE